MKTRKTLTKFLAISMVLAALAVADLPSGVNWLQPVAAQTGDESVRFVSYASIGLVPGERVRVSVGNPEESGGTVSLSFSYYLAHGTNSWSRTPVFESEWKYVPVRAFRYSELSREDLKVDGETGTRRAEVLVGVSMMAPAGSSPEDFPVSLEILNDDTQDGHSTTVDSKYRLIILAAKRSKQVVRSSFLPGERLHYSFFNPKEEGSKTVRVTSYTYDSYGNLLRQSDPIELQPGDGHMFDIKRDDLRVPGEERTGRLQVQTVIKVTSIDGSANPVKLHVSMEHVDRTGSTSGGDYFSGTVSVSGDGF